MKIPEIIPKQELDWLKATKTDDEIIAIAKERYNKIKQQQKEQENQKQSNVFDGDNAIDGIVRGGAEATARGIAFVDGVSNAAGFPDLISDKFSNKNAMMLENLEEVKQNVSEKNLSPQRIAEKRAVDKELSDARGIENVPAVAKKLYDLGTNLDEVTTQGVVAGIVPTDPINAISAFTGGIGGKLIAPALGKVAFGVTDGVVVNAVGEYNIAKGSGKSDEEAKEIAIKGGVVGAIVPGTISTVAAFASGKKGVDVKLPKEEMQTSDIETPASNIDKVRQAAIDSGLVDEEIEVNTAIIDNTIENIKIIDEASKTATQVHEDTKIKIQEAYENGASLDEMLAIRNDIQLSEAEIKTNQILNNGEDVDPFFSGTRIINIVEDQIRLKSITDIELKQKLEAGNVSPELIEVGVKSYKAKSTRMLEDLISDKIASHLELQSNQIKNSVIKNVDLTNKKYIAKDMEFSKSLEKQEIDDFIDTNIGKEYVNESQRELIYALNRYGLVDDLKVSDIENLFKQKGEGAYQTTKDAATIHLDKTVSPDEAMQVLTHEYVHSATQRLLNNKEFYNDIDGLMKSASEQFKKNKIKDTSNNGFTTPFEFISEAFSNPLFAKSLNDTQLTPKMKKIYGVGEDISSVWDLVVDKFSKVIYNMTGRKFKVNKNSYFESINNKVSKQIQELENIKTKGLKDGIITDKATNRKNVEYSSKTTDNPTNGRTISNDNDGTDIKPSSKTTKLSNDDITVGKRPASSDTKSDLSKFDTDEVVQIKDKETFESIKESFEKDNDTLFAKGSPEQKEKRGIYNVQFNEKKSTRISKDIKLVDKAIKFEKGFENPNTKKGAGALHIKKHIGNDKNGWVTKEEVLSIGDVIRKVEPYEKNGKNVYEYFGDDGTRFRLVIGGKKENVISFYSNRKVGMENNTLTYIYSNSSSKKSIANNLEKSQEVLLHQKKVVEKNKNLFEKYDEVADKTIESLDNLFHGLDKKGNIKENTNSIADWARNNLVTNSFKAKEFINLLQASKNETSRLKVKARTIQDSLNTLSKEDSSSLVLALDGDIPKADIKAILGDNLYEVYNLYRNQIDTNQNALVEAGLLDKNVAKENYVKRFYEEHLKSKALFSGLFSSPHKIDTKNFKRKNLSLEQRDSINQIRDAGYVVARTLLEQNRQLQKAKFLKALSDEFSSKTEKPGFVQVDDIVKNGLKVWGDLNGKFVPENIKNELDGIFRMESNVDGKLAKTFKDFTRWIKGTWTAGNPGTHLYNVISNNLNLYLNGLIFTTKNGRKFGGSRGVQGMKNFLSKGTKEAYKKELINAGLYDDNFFDMLDTRANELKETSSKNIAMQIINGAFFRKNSKFTQKIENLYDMEDKVFRVFAYEETKWDIKVEKFEAINGKVKKFNKEIMAKIEALELNEADMTKAMNEARDMFVDYSKSVPPIVSTLDNYMFAPFLRYTYLATTRQAKVAIKHPFRAAAVGLFMEEAIQGIFGDGEDLNSDDVLKTNWMETGLSNFNMYGANNFIKVGDNKEESTWLNQGRAIPGFRMFAVTAGLYGDIYKILIDNKDKYGRDIFSSHESNYIKAVKTMSKLSEMMVPPTSPIALPVYNGTRLTEGGNIKKDKNENPMSETVTIGGRYAQKLINGASGSKLDRYGNPIELTDVVKQMFGLKLEKINKKDEAARKIKDLNRKYKPLINRSKSLNEPKKKKEYEKEYEEKVKEVQEASGFDLGGTINSKKKSSSNYARFKI